MVTKTVRMNERMNKQTNVADRKPKNTLVMSSSGGEDITINPVVTASVRRVLHKRAPALSLRT